MSKKVIAYQLNRPKLGGQVCVVGITAKDVADAVRTEIESNAGLSVDECGPLTIEAFETTHEELDNLPEFEGW